MPDPQPEWGRAPNGLALEFFPAFLAPEDGPEETVLGKTRAQWDERLTRTHGPTYVQENQGHLDNQWEYILSL